MGQTDGMDLDRYLVRIGLDSPPPLDIGGLEALQRAHLTRVPFENLHVFHHRGVRTGADWSIPKIVDEGRGGWCFELNGAFAVLLEAIGFEVTLLGATVLLDGSSPGPAPDHATIRVDLDRPYLVDVGFGNSFILPLPLDNDGPHDGGPHRYRFSREDEQTTLQMETGDAWVPQYRFSMSPVTSADFDPSNHHLQTAPGVGFQKAPFATRLLEGGPDRVTLVHDLLKIRRGGDWVETRVTDDEWAEVLREWFGMDP